MVWKAYCYCFCGGWAVLSNRDRSRTAVCLKCKEELFPTLFTYDIDVAMNGGVPYIQKEINRLSNYTPLDGLNQFDFNKRFKTREEYEKEREEEKGLAEGYCQSGDTLPIDRKERQIILDNLANTSSFKPRANYKGVTEAPIITSRSLQEAIWKLGNIE